MPARLALLVVWLLAAESRQPLYPVDRGPLHGFGTRRHGSPLPLPTWGDLRSDDGHLGAICDPAAPRERCGEHLVCRLGVCRHCVEDSECPALQRCAHRLGTANMCQAVGTLAWIETFTNPWEFLCVLLIFCSATLAAAAGTGGGGVFVPLLIMLSDVKAEAAVPLSQCMVLCGSLVNLSTFVSQRHPDMPARPKIDYDCVVLFEPMLCLGVTLGVMVHQTIPKWFLLLLLGGTLGLALWRSLSKGLRQYWAEEKQQAAALGAAAAAASPVSDAEASPVETQTSISDASGGGATASARQFLQQHTRQMAGILAVWLTMLLASLHGMFVCTARFVTFLAALAVLLVAGTAVIERYVVQMDGEDEEGVSPSTGSPTKAISWKSPVGASTIGKARFPFVAFGAGLLGGMLGLGGGIIVGPVLLEVGMHSEAVQATTAVFVFLSSSLATVQFALLSQHIWHYALWYSAVVGAATLLGQRLCETIVRRHKRYSVITLSIAAVLAASLAALSVVGARQMLEDVRLGRQMWFSTARLCSGGVGIVRIDVSPAQTWPSDLPAWPQAPTSVP